MKGKRRFTRKEAEHIRSLLRKKCRSVRSEQKSIRGRLRLMGFFIIDWDNSFKGFRVADFDQVVKNRQIRIVGD